MPETGTSETGTGTTTEGTESTSSTEDPQSTGSETGNELQSEVDKWKALSKKNEDRAKANANAAKELEELRAKTMSEQEKAVAAAKAEGRTEALKEASVLFVDAEVKAAAAGRKIDVDKLLAGLDRSAFLNDEGKPDTKAIEDYLDGIAPRDGRPDLGQGTRGTGAQGADMNTMLRQAAGRA
jgi:membrane protein involved in colicin uptake